MTFNQNDDMMFEQMASYVRQAKAIIPCGGIYGDMRMVLGDVLNRKSEDTFEDLRRVRNACEPLPWEWAQSATKLLEQAADCLENRSETPADQS